MQYNFVIFGTKDDYYQWSYQDVYNRDDIKYLTDYLPLKVPFLSFFRKLHLSKTVNQKINLPFKKIWNKSSYFKNDFIDQSKRLCFVFFAGRRELIRYGVLDYLKDRYPDALFVCFFQDLVGLNTSIPFEVFREKSDLILSFDHKDCEDFGLVYYPLVFSDVPVPENSDIEKSDVFFVGKAKNRLDEILDAYEVLRDAGLKCDFHITGVAPENQKFKDEINYCDQMPYLENLQRINASRCVLEIMQKGGYGYTQRTCETIIYDKKLLSNNKTLLDAPFYRPDCVSVFSDARDIDVEFVKSGGDTVDYNYKEKLSPIRMLEYIEDYFSKQRGNQ